MKFAWVLEGPYWESGSYQQQVNLISDGLHEVCGYESAVANVPTFDRTRYQMLVMDKLRKYRPDFLISYGSKHMLNIPELLKVPMLSWVFQGGSDVTAFDGPVRGVTFGCISKSCHDKVSKIDPDALYVPHAFDPEVFCPGDQEAARAYLGIPYQGHRPVVVMVGTNYGDDLFRFDRKNWAGGLNAFAKLLKDHPDALLYIHSNNLGGFINLTEYSQELGISDSVILADQSHFHDDKGWDYPAQHVAEVYRAGDVLLFPSIEEGFGLPLIEAQACGIPVVTSNSGPMAELAVTGNAVETIPVERTDSVRPDETLLTEALAKWLYYERVSPSIVSKGIGSYSVKNVLQDHFIPAIKATLAKGV